MGIDVERNLMLLGVTSDFTFLRMMSSISSKLYCSFTLTSTMKSQVAGTTLCALLEVSMDVTDILHGPRSSEFFGKLKVLNQLMSSIAMYIAFSPSCLAA